LWPDSYQQQEVYVEAPRVRRPRPSVLPRDAAKAEKVAAEGTKPKGPLVIAISIQRQQVKVYDANGLFAESPISSGMPGHSTPLGVFSIIQKHKFHRSNIYSGAPMPYMQRITWSGVAMHAGVLPGYPASHGCIRLPMSFAMKMWGWTRMGARVLVTPGEVSPADFAHPALAALVPAIPVAAAPDTPASSNIKTADASNSMVGQSSKVMADTASGGISAITNADNDVGTVASIVSAAATSDPSATVVADDGMPPAPTPAAVDFSDLQTVAPVDTAEAAADVVTEAVGSVSAAVEPAKDQAQIASTPSVSTTPAETAPVAILPAMKGTSPVAIFVSRKDQKLYARQNFTPLFDMPITIAGDKALGTHVFTARRAGDDGKALQWTVVSLPAVARQAAMGSDERGSRRRSRPVEIAQVITNTPEDALARLAIPTDLMTRLGDALPPGSSLVVSDQGIAQGETGEGTDFIIRLR
jgi:hypothetical protein